MPMKNLDTQIMSRDDIRAMMQTAIREDNTDQFNEAWNLMFESIGQDIQQRYEDSIQELSDELDSRVLAARGVRQLTQEERKYYKELAAAMKARDPKQAVNNMSSVMPETVVNAVFEELQTQHPLLSRIDFMPSGGAVKLIMNTNSSEPAAWGTLCAEIVKELTSGFQTVNTTLLKLSAFLPVCKAMLDLGPEWLDNYVRQVLYEAVSNGMEVGIVAGDGKEEPIGMIRQVGPGTVVTDGVYPAKATIALNEISASSIGNLLGIMALDGNGKSRQVRDVIFLCNPQDYFQKVMPATTLMAPDGSYRNDVMPYPMTIIPTAALETGKAVVGMAYRYFAAAGTSPEGRIEYSDDYHFIEDERMYLIKAYANGLPKDNNSFLYLDISGLTPAIWKVEQVDGRTKSSVNTLSALKLGGLTLSPAFAASTASYTATAATGGSNMIFAAPTDAGATMLIKQGTAVKANGDMLTWAEGENTVTVKVTPEDGGTAKTYTITVTAS